MTTSLSWDLHALVARLDRAADRLLTAECGLSYSRFRALLVLQDSGPTTQREWARVMGVTEPSASRMAAALAQAGLVQVGPDPSGGNRRRLQVTPEGARLVRRAARLLEGRLEDVVHRSGVDHARYAESTRLLLRALDEAGA